MAGRVRRMSELTACQPLPDCYPRPKKRGIMLKFSREPRPILINKIGPSIDGHRRLEAFLFGDSEIIVKESACVTGARRTAPLLAGAPCRPTGTRPRSDAPRLHAQTRRARRRRVPGARTC